MKSLLSHAFPKKEIMTRKEWDQRKGSQCMEN